MMHSRPVMPDRSSERAEVFVAKKFAKITCDRLLLLRRQLTACLIRGFLLGAPILTALAEQPKPQQQQLFYIPHTHWEGAVFKTREEYLEMGLPNILKAVQLLKQYPEYKFALDQVAYFRPFLERYPEEAAAFRKFVAEGRLEIVGGMDVMPER